MEDFAETALSYDCVSGRVAGQVSDFLLKKANNVGKPFDPRSQPLARRQEHFNAPMADGCFVVFHLFGHFP